MKNLNRISKIMMMTAVMSMASFVYATETNPHAGHDMNNAEIKEVTVFDKNSGETHQMNVQADPENSSVYATEYTKINSAMHHDMNVEDKGNPDVYFVKSMLAHHVGAIEMARVQLKYGQDQSIKDLAEDIITKQEAEVSQMKQWLSTHQ
jgi:uncharacterized protein (DUF305 family)